MDAKTPKLHLEFLGCLRVRVNGNASRELSGQQSGALLAYLALNPGRSHAREELIDLFWQDDDAEEGRRKLRQSVYTLRKLLEDSRLDPDAIVLSSRNTLRLNPAAVTMDVHEFEAALRRAVTAETVEERLSQLRRADALYRGDLLPGLYQEVFDSDRRRLEGLRRRMLCDLSQAYGSAGELGRAIEIAQRIIALDPLVEEAHADLMHLYAKSGRVSEVLRQYRDLEKVLAVELGEAPAPAIRDLAERLRAEAELRSLSPTEPRLDSSTEPRAESSACVNRTNSDPAQTVECSLRDPRSFAIADSSISRRARRRLLFGGPSRRFALAAPTVALALAITHWIMVARRDLPAYALYDLGTFGGEKSQPARINDSGVVVGLASNTLGGPYEGCVWLGTRGAFHLPGVGGPVNGAADLNDDGQMVGVASDNHLNGFPILWDQTGAHIVPEHISMEGINSTGKITGNVRESDGPARSVIMDSWRGPCHDLGSLGGETEPTAINSTDHIVGNSRTTCGLLRAFFWSRTGGMRDIGTLGGAMAVANGLNDACQVVGKAQLPNNGPMHAFVWDAEHGMRDIGPPDCVSEASRINSKGQAVGHYETESSRGAFLWSAKIGTVDLASLLDSRGEGWKLDGACDINTSGWIAAFGIREGMHHCVLLIPHGSPSLTVDPSHIPLLRR